MLALDVHGDVDGSFGLPERRWIMLRDVSGEGKTLGVKGFNVGIDPVDLPLFIQASRGQSHSGVDHLLGQARPVQPSMDVGLDAANSYGDRWVPEERILRAEDEVARPDHALTTTNA